jgi:cellulose synthase/poly-beta-1,6-N-acetylglucosamine synthase-like glycosyltransferase
MSYKVSIVIPAHNEEASIAATLEKVCALDYPDFEVIVVDNASIDKTGEIAQQFPVKVVREEKKGLLHARERGRVEAKGDIIANIDADCLPKKKWLKNGIKFFNNERVVAVSGPYYYFDGSWFFRTTSFFLQKHVYTATSVILQRFKKTGVLIGGNNLIRAKVLEETGGYDTSIIFYGEDTATARKIAEKGTIVFSPGFVMSTSARRFESEGTFKIFGLYLYHFFKAAFKNPS